MKIILIAAMARGRVIGRSADNSIPWSIPEDMAHFKATTMDRYVIMGRKTWESIPPRYRPLPGRFNVVITRQLDYQAPGTAVGSSLERVLRNLDDMVGVDVPVYIIGGQSLYEEAMPYADEMILTNVHASIEGDVLFPFWHLDQWFNRTIRANVESKSGHTFDICHWVRTTMKKPVQ